MTCKGWFSKYDVMRDIALVSGVRASFDDNSIIGEQPPPPLTYNEVGKYLFVFTMF